MTATTFSFPPVKNERRLISFALLSLLPFAIALTVYSSFWLATQPEITGDEPHYIVYAYSIAHDHDLDLQNNYENDDVKRFGYGGELEPHAFDYGDGGLRTWHGIALALVMAPVMLVTTSITAIRLELALITALLAQQVFGLIRDFGVRDGRIVWPVWAVTMFSIPVLAYSSQAFPELPAGLLLIVGIRFLLHGDSPAGNLLPALGCAVIAPWFNARYLVVMGGLGLGIAARLLVRWRGVSWTPRVVFFDIVPLAAVTLAGLGGLAAFNWTVYGSPGPNAMLNPPSAQNPGALTLSTPYSLPNLYFFGLALLVHPIGGWLPFAPAHWLGFAGLLVFGREHRLMLAWGLVVLALFLVAGSPYSPGFCPPARYVVAFVPLVSVPLALLLARLPIARVPFAALAIVCAVMSIGAARDFMTLYPWFRGETTIPIARQLQSIWPLTYAPDPIGETGFLRPAPRLLRRTGEITTTQPTAGDPPGRVVYAAPGRHPASHMAYGPYVKLAAGDYVAKFTLAAGAQPRGDLLALLDVTADEASVGASPVFRRTLPPGEGYRLIEVPFSLDKPSSVQTRIFFTAAVELWFRQVEVVRLGAPPPPAPNRGRYPDWQKMLAWGAVTVAAATGALLAAKREPPA